MRLSRANKCVAHLCLAFLCLGAVALSKPLERDAELDPMMSLPSDGQQLYRSQEIRYVTYQQQQPGGEHQQEASQHKNQHQHQELVVQYQPQVQQQQQQQEEVVYAPAQSQEQPLAPYQLVQLAAAQAQTQPQSAPVKQDSGEPTEYPGEIIYVDQNGQVAEQQTGANIANVANSIAQSSGLSATILTEVPIKDMPQEVLAKLKREYGVKVVATRERPGANLVINCDDQSTNVESSICARQQQQQQAPTSAQRQAQVVAYGYPKQAVEEHEHQPQAPPLAVQQRHTLFRVEHEVMPHTQAEPQHAYVTQGLPETQGQPQEYREVVEVVHQPQEYHLNPQTSSSANEQQPQGDGQTTTVAAGQYGQQPPPEDDYYGARATTAAVEQPAEAGDGSQVTPAEHPGGEHQQQSPAHESEPASTNSETQDQNVGFDEQPKNE